MDSMDTVEKDLLSIFDEGKAFPPGFRFYPTDEELVLYHLKGKMCHRRFKLDVIAETNVYLWRPEEFPGLSKLKTGDRQWFFFTPRDHKYPNAARSNRTTKHGYWKLTGKDRVIQCNSRAVGVKKTLVYYLGRSPNGDRTDWVMHEYTLTEDEVKRCQSITDYYALYKVFKKSGPGPKNGEQYGAPFREEDWEHEVEANDNNRVEPVNNVKEVEAPLNSVCDLRATAELQTLVDDFDEFMNKIADDPIPVQSIRVEPNGFSLGDILAEEEAHLSEQSLIFQSACQNYNGEASFDISQYNNEAPEVTSTVINHLPEINAAEGDAEEFIEMDDLFGPDFTVQRSDKPIQELDNSQFDEFVDGLEEFELYKDLLTSLGDGEVRDQGVIYQQDMSMNDLNNVVVNSNYNFEEQGRASFQQPYLHNVADATNFLQLSHDQTCNTYDPGDARQDQSSSLVTPGVVYDSNSSNHQTGGSWKQDDDGKDSRISSMLWSFVESIPTTPASAAENALVNRAFERMSSFSKLRLNYSNNAVDVAATSSGSNSTGSISSGKHRNGLLLCVSLVGILCAVLWMMICGTAT